MLYARKQTLQRNYKNQKRKKKHLKSLRHLKEKGRKINILYEKI